MYLIIEVTRTPHASATAIQLKMRPSSWARRAYRSLQAASGTPRALCPCPQRLPCGWRAPPAAAAAAGAQPGSSGTNAGAGAASSSQSELVTRSILGYAGALCGAGLPPGAVAAFSSGGE
jgi:hypothetical protein